jgi:eukaryotic-like serine/threonine-protein kinase
MNVGDQVSDYQIVQVLGAGGMGEVFKVRNALSGRIEAMKVLHSDLAGDKDLADRFLREIRVQAALDHPHIARLHTAQVVNNQLIMVMEFVDGESLAQMLQRGPLTLGDSIRYGAQVLDALGYAHAQGVVHRDIKPANIMCTKDGVIKLMDFGIARMKQDQRLTETGRTVGSLHYMSPEQIRGTDPEPRSDIYSFGITLYEMVTGKRPFDGPSNYSIMSAHLQQQPVPPVNMIAGVPQALNEIILMSIAKDPTQRFQTAQAFSGALQSLMGQAQATAQMSPAMAPTTAQVAPPPMAPPMGPGPMRVTEVQAQQMPPMPAGPPPPQKSRRALYMVLGSVATIAVLVLAAIELPKYIGVGANGTTKPSTATAAPATITPVSTTPPATTPAATTPEQDAAAAAASASASSSSSSSSAVAKPVKETAQANPPRVVPPPVLQQNPPVQQPPVQQPPVAVVNPMNEIREQYNELSIKLSAARSGMESIQSQMARQGLGMRRDIVEAQTRADYQMKEAMDSIRSGDAAGAREHLQYASGNIATIDKFLGR